VSVAAFVALFFPVPAQADDADVTVTVRFFECNDSTDNDGDSLIDWPSDPGCDEAMDDDETDTALPACSDGEDNDGDGKTDYPDDPGCSSSDDSSEADISTGGGGAPAPPLGTLIFTGEAPIGSRVTLLMGSAIISQTVVGSEASFRMKLVEVTPGEHRFSLYSTDVDGVRSGLVSFTLESIASALTEASNIVIPPTVSLVEGGTGGARSVTVFGYTLPNRLVTLLLGAESIQSFQVQADGRGYFTRVFNQPVLSEEEYVVRARILRNDLSQVFSAALLLSVSRGGGSQLRGDFNGDGRVNLIDFSILAYWLRRENVPNRFDLNQDGVLDLRDFSVMLYYWSG